MNAERVPYEAPEERSGVCFGGFRPTKHVEGPQALAYGAPLPLFLNLLFSSSGFTILITSCKHRFEFLPPNAIFLVENNITARTEFLSFFLFSPLTS
jgi:hypothetical protein